MKVLKDFVTFLKRPSLENQIGENTIPLFITLIWRSFLIILLIDALVFFTISSPLKYFNLFPSQIEINLSFYSILKLSLLFPITEELIFRLPLLISRINLAISISLISFVLLIKLNIYLSISLSLSLLITILFVIKKESNIFYNLKYLSTRYFLIIFYSQAIIFGLLHLNNYRLDIHYFYLFPFYVTSQIIIGCFFGYLRVRYSFGIWLCIVTHVVINSVNCLLLFK